MEDIPGLKAAIAAVVRQIRKDAGLSQQKLADFAGLSRIHIAQIEGCKRNTTINALLLIGRVADISLSEMNARIEMKLQEIAPKE